MTFEEAAALLTEYDEKLDRLSTLKGGVANSSFHATTTDGSELVVTVLDNHDNDSASSLVALTRWLVDRGVRTPPILQTTSGSSLGWFNGKPVVVRPFIHGSQPGQLSVEQAQAIGESMASYHSLDGANVFTLPTRRLPIGWEEDTEARAGREVHEVVSAAAAEFATYPASGRLSLIHGDLFPDNMIWDNQERLHVLDWETAAVDWAPLDLGFTLVGLAAEGPFDQGLCNGLLAGYARGGGNTPTGEDVRVAARYACAVLLFHRYRRHVVRYPDPARVDHWKGLLPFLDSVTP